MAPNASTSGIPTRAVPGQARGFPAEYKRLPPAGRESWLAGDECRAMVVSGRLQQNQVKAEAARIEKATNRVRQLVPSPNRLDEYRRGYAFPPKAEHTPMELADWMLDPAVERHVLWPAHYLHGDPGRRVTYDVVCMDTAASRKKLGMDDPIRSPSAAAIDKLAAVGGRCQTELKLASEDEHVLRRQIAAYTGDRRFVRLEKQGKEFVVVSSDCA
jgi:hypothetical protein